MEKDHAMKKITATNFARKRARTRSVKWKLQVRIPALDINVPVGSGITVNLTKESQWCEP